MKVVDFLIGDPDHDPPDVIRHALIEGVGAGADGYTNQQGSLAVRKAISGTLRKDGVACTEDNIFVSSGSKPIAWQFLTIHNRPEDKVALYAPYYPSYFKQIKFEGLVPQIVHKEAELLKLIKTRTVQAVILISPNNPDGKVWDPVFLREILDLSRHMGCQVVLDEAYCHFIYSEVHDSLLSMINVEDYQNLLVIRSFSKSLGICGWRLGYAVAASKICQQLTEVQATMLNPPSSLVQYAIAKGLMRVSPSYYEQNRQEYLGKLRKAVDIMRAGGVQVNLPEGGFYLFIDIEEHINGHYADIRLYVEDLASEYGVRVWPGTDFGAQNHIRISVASATQMDIEKGCYAILRSLKGCKK